MLHAVLRAAAKERDDAHCEQKNVSTLIETYGTALADTRALLGKAMVGKADEVRAHAETKSSLERLRKDHEVLVISKGTFSIANIEVKSALERLTKEHAELLAVKTTYLRKEHAVALLSSPRATRNLVECFTQTG